MHKQFQRAITASLAVTLAGMPLATTAAQTSASAQFNHTISLPGSTSHLDVFNRYADFSASTLSELLAGRFAGVQVTSVGALGTASRIRIRGQSSLLLGNDPLLVVDGIRLYDAPPLTSNSAPSRFDDIRVSDIQDIEILTGAVAALRYGSGATNGVISITTRRGTSGKIRVDLNTQHGIVSDPASYSDLWQLRGKRGTSATSSLCTLSLISSGACVADSLSRGNVLAIDSLTPISIGYRNEVNARVSGGTSRIRFAVAGNAEREIGVFKMPAYDERRLVSERGVTSLPADQLRPSALTRNSAHLNVSARPLSSLDVQLSGSYLDGDSRFMIDGARSDGISYNAMGGPLRFDLKDRRGLPLLGYTDSRPGDLMAQTLSQRVHRFVNSAAVCWCYGHACDRQLLHNQYFGRRSVAAQQ